MAGESRNMAGPSMRRAYYVLSSHWDREWHQPFQHFRYRLVQMLDRVLDGLAGGRLTGPFTLDGQSILLEDYLEIRPERFEQVEGFLAEGKLRAGPWYVLPDEFLVSGESLVRNLRLGRDLVRQLGGEPSRAGWLADLFGHNSQMPQILRGFGIPGALLWRGVNLVDHRHFLWRGADGTEMAAYRFGRHGYCEYAMAVRHADEPQRGFDAEEARRDLQAYLEREAAVTQVDPLLALDGCDHQFWDEACYDVLRERLEQPSQGFEVVHAGLDDYLAEMAEQAERISERREGELREPGRPTLDVDRQFLLPGVLSSRVWIRLANAECETLLCQWAEPTSVMAAGMLGTEYPEALLRTAWKWLLQNHPHDSICGCSVDLVHDDMKYRFSQCRQIADRLTQEATTALAANAAGKLEGNELRVVVINPLPVPYQATGEITLPIPADWPAFGEFFNYEPKPALRIYTSEGDELPYQRVAQAIDRSRVRVPATKIPEVQRVHEVTVSLPLDVPPMGYTTLVVRAGRADFPTRHPERPDLVGEASARASSEEAESAPPAMGMMGPLGGGMGPSATSLPPQSGFAPAAAAEKSELRVSMGAMENEFLAVAVEPGGTLALTDKRSGRTCRGLLALEDGADIGDGWYHGTAVNDEVCGSAGGSAEVSVVHQGPMLAALRIRTRLRVPAEFCFRRMVRSGHTVELPVESLVSLRPGVDFIDVETTVHNTAADHRLRLLLPSGCDARTYLADTPFDVVERPIRLRPDNHEYRELEVETRPQQSWTAVFDDQGGLAVICPGLRESAVLDRPGQPIALTLLRSTRRTVFTDGEPGGLMRGQSLVYRCRIVPLTGAPDRARLCLLGQQLAAGVRSVALTPKDLEGYGDRMGTPPSASFLEIRGPVVVTSYRQADGAMEIRLFNPNEQPADVAMRMPGRWQGVAEPVWADMVDFESQPTGDGLAVTSGAMYFSLRPKQITTLRISH